MKKINFTVPKIKKGNMENTQIQYQAHYTISHLIPEHAFIKFRNIQKHF